MLCEVGSFWECVCEFEEIEEGNGKAARITKNGWSSALDINVS